MEKSSFAMRFRSAGPSSGWNHCHIPLLETEFASRMFTTGLLGDVEDAALRSFSSIELFEFLADMMSRKKGKFGSSSEHKHRLHSHNNFVLVSLIYLYFHGRYFEISLQLLRKIASFTPYLRTPWTPSHSDIFLESKIDMACSPVESSRSNREGKSKGYRMWRKWPPMPVWLLLFGAVIAIAYSTYRCAHPRWKWVVRVPTRVMWSSWLKQRPRLETRSDEVDISRRESCLLSPHSSNPWDFHGMVRTRTLDSQFPIVMIKLSLSCFRATTAIR